MSHNPVHRMEDAGRPSSVGMVLDSLAGRLTAAILVAMLIGALLEFGSGLLIRPLSRPPFERSGLPQVATEITHILEVSPAGQRNALAAAATTQAFQVKWYPRMPLRPPAIASLYRIKRDWPLRLAFEGLHLSGRPIVFRGDEAAASEPELRGEGRGSRKAYFLLLPLADGGWAGFSAGARDWGPDSMVQIVLTAGFLLASAIGVALVQARLLVRPLQGFNAGIRRFAADLRAAPIPEAGPLELKHAISAVNAMQIQIQKFVEERALLFATLSHDLRTPLTRLRLRAERVEGAGRQDLLRNVDAMSAMIETALAVFTDQSQPSNAPTLTDIGALVQGVVDEWADQGVVIPVRRLGSQPVTALARPAALQRALENVVDNAVRYAGGAEIIISDGPDQILVEIQDRGPGLPLQALKQVFQPYARWDSAADHPNGLGLGLASTRAIIHAHAGEVSARNRRGGGLAVSFRLPCFRKPPPQS